MTERSEKIKNRFMKWLENGEITMGHEIEIMEYMVNILNPISTSEYARHEGISRPAAKKRIESGKQAFLTIGSQKFII